MCHALLTNQRRPKSGAGAVNKHVTMLLEDDTMSDSGARRLLIPASAETANTVRRQVKGGA